ncbi:hypothetical protein GCM10023144_15780 [Pigmentiphaga soli]|uniref:DUF3318 domain-containing protein n=1 Tax=Pigmentiphaga soli TaxID=1007095 RepID=A0ABP8GSJ9_9BURK
MSTPRMQARKELLLARASIERIEFAAHVGRVRSALSPSNLLRSVMSKASSRVGSKGALTTAFRAWRLVRRYPILSSAASMLLARLPLRGAFRLLKLGGLGVGAWQAWRVWQAVKSDPARSRRRQGAIAPVRPRSNPPAP